MFVLLAALITKPLTSLLFARVITLLVSLLIAFEMIGAFALRAGRTTDSQRLGNRQLHPLHGSILIDVQPSQNSVWIQFAIISQ